MSSEVADLVSLAVRLDLLADREQSLAESGIQRFGRLTIEGKMCLSHRDALRLAARSVEEIARRTDIGAYEASIAALEDAGVM